MKVARFQAGHGLECAMSFLENIDDERVPVAIRERLRKLRAEVEAICEAAKISFVTEIPRRISYKMHGNSSTSWAGDLMPPEERAQAISFVVRYEHLPDDVKVHIGPIGTEWHIKNLWELRHTLNDFRPIIQNQNDSTFYTNVHATIQKRLRRKDPDQGLILQVYEGSSNVDVTVDYAKFLAETTKAITAILEALEFGYLYNGILQHSDESYSKRFLNDYTSGEFNYILWKHVAVLGQVRYWLTHFYRILNVLNFPSLGSLTVKTTI
jgi:hypothetical protein